MLEDLEEGGEIQDIDLDIDGKIKAPVTDKIALIDADTLAYTACLNIEQQEDLLPREMYTDEEYQKAISHPNYDPDTNAIWTCNIDMAYDKAMEKLERIYDKTGCRTCEMHFTGGRENFRYTVLTSYKANRTGRPPAGLSGLKAKLMENFESTISTEYEADDIVVYKARIEPEKYVVVAVDKDVYFALPGIHFNYYESARYNIEMKWMPYWSEENATKWPFMQAIIGDTVDNIKGIHGKGKAAATKAFAGCITERECWDALVLMYEADGQTQLDALVTMRLVHMHQFDGTKINLWNPKELL